MSRNVIISTVVVIIVVVLALYFLMQSQYQAPTTTSTQPTPQSNEGSPSAASGETGQITEQQNLVTISSAGFSPKDITVKIGTVVTWFNEDSEDHTVNSAVHPTHQLYPPLNNVGTLKPGEKKGFLFDKAGSYKYHDHLNPALTGSVTVE